MWVTHSGNPGTDPEWESARSQIVNITVRSPLLVGQRDLWLASVFFVCLMFHNWIKARAGQKVVLSEPANKGGESYGQN